MQALLKYTAILTIAVSCQNSGSTEPAETDTLKSITVDTVHLCLKPYSNLEYQKRKWGSSPQDQIGYFAAGTSFMP
jgi:hypothetical protein